MSSRGTIPNTSLSTIETRISRLIRLNRRRISRTKRARMPVVRVGSRDNTLIIDELFLAIAICIHNDRSQYFLDLYDALSIYAQEILQEHLRRDHHIRPERIDIGRQRLGPRLARHRLILGRGLDLLRPDDAVSSCGLW